MLTNGNLRENARILAGMHGVIEPDILVAGVLPEYHIFGIMSMMNVSMYSGLTFHLIPHFDPGDLIRVVESEERTIIFAVPTMYG